MQTIWSLYGMGAFILLASIAGYGAMILVTNPHVKEITTTSPIKIALRIIGIVKPAWQTLIVSASQDVNLPVEDLWNNWTELEKWPVWSKPLYRSTRWISAGGWEKGAEFEQVTDLGIPFGPKRSRETVGDYEPMRRVRWCKTAGGVKSCHVWSFTLLPNRRVRVTNTEVFHGTMIGLLKPIVAWRWQRMFDAAVTGLVQQTRETSQS